MTAAANSSEIRLKDIRAHEGSQARAWEELAYQLRPPVNDGHVQTRKTRAPDAGLEWYEVYEDGHQEGFQAKFNASLEDALGGMRESVEAVCTKRPNLTKLTFVVPYDFTDSGEAKTKTDQDRWNDAVNRWKADFEKAKDIQFATIRAGDITAKLALKEHAGRREYWFGGLELTDAWLAQRFAESVAAAGDRYTPEADASSSVNIIIDAAANGPTFIDELNATAARASRTCRYDTGMWGTNTAAVTALLDNLDACRARSFGGSDDDAELLPSRAPDLARFSILAQELASHAHIARDNLAPYERRNIDSAISALANLHSLSTGNAAAASVDKAFALVGPAGQGKTHALMRAVEACLERGVPALAVLGQRLSDQNWWPAIADSLGLTPVGSDNFLQALDSMAEARACRALVVIDAINEAQSPKRWRDELPAMLTQFRKFAHLALVVSYRTDYRDVVGAPESLLRIHHPGLAGNETEALGAYCSLFGIAAPSKGLFEPALSSPLFLRMYCEVIADDPSGGLSAPTRSNLFERYAQVTSRKVAVKLALPPTTPTVRSALTLTADRILSNDGRPVARDGLEQEVDNLLPGRIWPNTLFQQMASEGLIELRPTYDGTESVAFPFQAYSEHLLTARLLASVDASTMSWAHRLTPLPRRKKRVRALTNRIAKVPWSWRSLAVVLPEKENLELIDLLPQARGDFRLQEAMRESLTDRAAAAFGPRALELLREYLESDPDEDGSGIEILLALAPREGHPGNADWLHTQLSNLNMADRDATWSIVTFQADEYSGAYRRLTRWGERLSDKADDEEVRLASTALMWLLTSPNRFLRDGASKTLVKLLSEHLHVAASLVRTAQNIDDPYVQERALTCSYGAILVGGDADPNGSYALLKSVVSWQLSGLPIDVVARDSVRGIAAWCAARGLLGPACLSEFAPPYGAAPPDDPPTREQLEAAHGPIKDADGNFVEWRASSILHSCLDWYGDFNKYVVKSDVEFFSWHPLSGPTPTQNDHKNPMDEVEVNWAGRWIAARAIALGWTTDRFEDFERSHDLRRGRDAHKAEQFGKKYQWIAHRELLARLADNFHPSYETWRSSQQTYQGPWAWYGRDFDPTLPPSVASEGSQVCVVARDASANWATLVSPAMDIAASPDEWVGMRDDLPDTAAMFSCTDPHGRRWIAIQRYATWDRANAQRIGMTKRERDVFFLQFSWLVPRGQGGELYEFIEQRGLSGRWMPDTSRTHHQYLGEGSSAPIVATADFDLSDHDVPNELHASGIRPRPAVEQYLWEGNTLDCSIDESINFYVPTPELLGPARWVGHQSAWSVDGKVIARAIEVPDGKTEQNVLVADREWLMGRLRELDTDMVIGTLSERHALPFDDDDYQHMAFSDVWYVNLLTADGQTQQVGPLLEVRRRSAAESDSLEVGPGDEDIEPDEPFDHSEV